MDCNYVNINRFFIKINIFFSFFLKKGPFSEKGTLQVSEGYVKTNNTIEVKKMKKNQLLEIFDKINNISQQLELHKQEHRYLIYYLMSISGLGTIILAPILVNFI